MIRLEDLFCVYYKARSNKRRSRDSVVFEQNLERNLYSLWKSINERTFRADSNYAFVVFSPKPREIFETEMKNRIIHHYLDWRLRQIYESVLSERTFNNRKGKGLHKAINTYRQDIIDLTENFTKDAWLVHLDLKGYFPNADVEIALSQQLRLIDRFYEGEDNDDLKFMMEKCMRSDPARHCSVFVPRENWNAIAPEKSLFNKPVGTGAAIGFLCWQNAMGLYINDVILWLQKLDFMRIVVFVDDIYIVTNDKSKFLSLMPEIRSSLAPLKVQLNERKFYCQHYSKGIMCLGTMLKFGRRYIKNTTFSNAMRKIDILSVKRDGVERIICSLNSYIGYMKNIEQKRRMWLFVEKALSKFKNVLYWNSEKNSFSTKELKQS